MMYLRADSHFVLYDADSNGFGKAWRWIVGLGVAMIALGAVAIGTSMLVTLMTMILLGILMSVGGMLQTVHAISLRRWSGYYVDAVAGIMYMVAGFLITFNPETTALGLTLLLVFFLFGAGVFRIVAGCIAMDRLHPWLIVYGVLNIVLSYVIWHDWPVAGRWIIGLLIGMEVLCKGWSVVMLGLAVRASLPTK